MMLSKRLSCILCNSLYIFIFVSALSHVVIGLLVTLAALIGLYVYHIPVVPAETVNERLKQTTSGEVLSQENPNIILHRGGVFDLPENTLEGLRLAHECGAGAVEIDLEFTEDGVGVLLHDSTVDRTTDGTGSISKMKYECVQKLDAAAKHECRSKCGPMKVPTLEECVKECLKLNLRLYIDCKSQPQRTAELLSSLFKKFPDLYHMAIVCSFYPQVIYAVRKKDPTIMTALTHRSHVLSANLDGTHRNKEMWKRIVAPFLDYLLQWSHHAWLWFLCGNSFFLLQKDDVSRNMLKYWKSLGIQVVLWTVNDPKEKEYFLQTVKCPVITDGMNSKE